MDWKTNIRPSRSFYADKESLEAKGAKIYMESPVTAIDYDAKRVTALVNGQEHVESYEKLILATGSTPILPPIKGAAIKEGSRDFEATLKIFNLLNCIKMQKMLLINYRIRVKI